MNPSHDMTNDFNLLGKYLSGEASPGEAMQVEAWLAADPANGRLFREISSLWDSLTGDKPHQLPDKALFFQQIKALQRNGPTAAVTVRKLPSPHKKISRWLTIAACLVVITVVAFYFLKPGKFTANGPVTTLAPVLRQATETILNDTLPDGSVAVLNSNTRIEYLPSFNAQRQLDLKGEAWFNIVSDAAKPFVIRVGPIQVIVLGTTFNIKQHADSIEVSLKTGLVRMVSASDSITLQPGQKGVFHISGNRFSILGSFSGNDIGYATKSFDFKNETLGRIAAQIGKAYSIKIIFENQELAACTLSSTFDNQSLDYVLTVIAATLNIQYQTIDKTVYIRGKSCL